MDDSIILSNCQKDKIQQIYNKWMRTFLFVVLLKFGLSNFYHTAIAGTSPGHCLHCPPVPKAEPN